MSQWHNNLANVLSLDGEWQLSLKDKTAPVCVPGAWEAQGFDHRAEGPAVMRRTVYVPSEWRGQWIQLQFDAVSYHVEVSVNGAAVGTHTGLWTPFALDVSDVIQ